MLAISDPLPGAIHDRRAITETGWETTLDAGVCWALMPLLAFPYLVCERFLRRVGRDCLISFDASWYSVPARRLRAGQQVEVRVEADTNTIHATGDGTLLAHTLARPDAGRG